MKYRLTCLTPTLIGDGQKLSPIDYMVWKDHVNVLDQRRIFRLLAKGPRLEGYLTQLKKAEKLDFASWGGFAQNFAGRRIPFEHPSAIPYWEKARGENLFIPTFAIGSGGPYVPGTAIKGALRTGAVSDRWTEASMRELAARLEEDRMPRNPAAKAEDAVLGGSGNNRMRRLAASDSASITHAGMKVYLLRVSTMVARGNGKYELGWKRPGGSVDSRKIDDATPIFAEMASPGTAFDGIWRERSLGDRAKLFQASNRYAAGLIAKHKEYAARFDALAPLTATLGALEARIAEIGNRPDVCLLSIGWGGGMLGKVAFLNTEDESYRRILRQTPFEPVIKSGMPFPKTRRIVFQGSHPASLPGWVMLEVA